MLCTGVAECASIYQSCWLLLHPGESASTTDIPGMCRHYTFYVWKDILNATPLAR